MTFVHPWDRAVLTAVLRDGAMGSVEEIAKVAGVSVEGTEGVLREGVKAGVFGCMVSLGEGRVYGPSAFGEKIAAVAKGW